MQCGLKGGLLPATFLAVAMTEHCLCEERSGAADQIRHFVLLLGIAVKIRMFIYQPMRCVTHLMELGRLKRLFDIVASFFGLLLLSPVIAIVAWQIRRKLGSPVLFRQVRPGKDGKPFEMIKFRTMRDAVDAKGNPLPDEERMTPFGSFYVPVVWMNYLSCGMCSEAI